MPKQKKSAVKSKINTGKIMRFAHPFFTNTPPAKRKNIPGVGNRMKAFAATKLEKIPPPIRDPTMTLAEIIGQQGVTGIETAKTISFHAIGDTGQPVGNMQEFVAEAMAMDYNPDHPEKSPAFFLHLGDVDYFDNTDKGYQAQFYVPYKKYPGKIIAIPGNHDGELFKWDGTSTGQKNTLDAFQRNFCQPKPGIPPGAGTIYREMVSQPAVYWYLNAPFIDIVALYSNVGESQGFISGGAAGGLQKTWLTKTLTTIKNSRVNGTRKALLLVVHHPPFSQGGHTSSDVMLADIDDSCKTAGIMPDAVLAAHSHDYQRYTRYFPFGGKTMEIPYYVAGGGGRGLSPHVTPANGARTGDHSYDSSLRGYGYLTITVTPGQLSFLFTEVDTSGKKVAFDKKVVVDLGTNKII
jgi:hypothetical protein